MCSNSYLDRYHVRKPTIRICHLEFSINVKPRIFQNFIVESDKLNGCSLFNVLRGGPVKKRTKQVFYYLQLIESLRNHNKYSNSVSAPKPFNLTNVDKLKRDLLKHYDTQVRPENHEVTTDVKLGIRFLRIELDEVTSTLKTHCWVDMVSSWTPT